ncbi:MAG: hypothetical protein JW870_07255 [Candidatus Delongbacteria bacterium]|nr:hypothetical protein [Candidatus Delongbacteria bacterium]
MNDKYDELISAKNTIKIKDVYNTEEGIRAENEYLNSNYFTKPGNWKKKYRLCKQINGIRYDIYRLESEDGKTEIIYFDISEFFGK